MNSDRPRESCIDLHTHSTASDGSDAPSALPRLASVAGLAAVALTDHDTVAGIPEFLAAGGGYPGVETIPGVELASLYGSRELHIVGLFIDWQSAGLAAFLAKQREMRRRRNEEIRAKLNILGYATSWSDEAFAGREPSTVGRPHFARHLCLKHGFADSRQAFDRLLGHSRPAYVPRKLGTCGEAIAAIHASGGVAVWAHPICRERNESAWLRRLARHLVRAGLDGIEGYYSLFGPPETALVTEVAAVNGLALSGGSDYHGANSPDIRLGSGMGRLRVPAALLEGLKKKREKYPGPTS
ncbi:MAG: PHP domain-containing protein [Lentisphaeria bacterium]|nr:PHP domain-containing protein [Lentisphaeria bacterium]